MLIAPCSFDLYCNLIYIALVCLEIGLSQQGDTDCTVISSKP